MTRLDHGILNVPLAKRGNIDAQIDAYKAQQTREAEAKRKAGRALVRKARALVRSLSDARLAELGKPHGLSIAKTRKMLLAAADGRAETVIATIEREAA